MSVGEPFITLVGRTSAWRWRLPCGPAEERASAAPKLLSTWVRHPAYGMIGVYLAAGATVSGPLRRGRRIAATGHVRLALAVALPDDPRSASDTALAPLLVAVSDVRTARRDARLPIRLESPWHGRALPPSPARPAQLAPLARWADAAYWRAQHGPPAVSVTWDTARGVVTRAGELSYVRYVLSLSARRDCERER